MFSSECGTQVDVPIFSFDTVSSSVSTQLGEVFGVLSSTTPSLPSSVAGGTFR